MDFKNGNYLVTGASRGSGRCIAERMLAAGANVVLVARTEELLQKLKGVYPERAHIFPYDLRDTENIETIFKYCKENGLKLNGLIHAAGITVIQPVKGIEIEVMDEVMRINYFSFAQMAKYFALKKYSEDGASVVAMSSIAAEVCEKGNCLYSASKAAINTLVRTMSREMIKRRIRVNAIAPAIVDTDMTKNAEMFTEHLEGLVKQQEYGLIPVEQIAYLAEFLLSDKASFITGTIIPISAAYVYL